MQGIPFGQNGPPLVYFTLARVTLRGRTLRLTGRIMWSRVIGRTLGAQSVLVFQGGVAFDKVSAEARTVIAGFLEEAPSPQGWRAMLEWREADSDGEEGGR